MKKSIPFLALTLATVGFTNQADAQTVTLPSSLVTMGYDKDGIQYHISGEISNTSGKNVRGVFVNVNYYDASGKKLKGSNFIEDNLRSNFSDQGGNIDYLAKGKTTAFSFTRMAEKINGKVARCEFVITATPIATANDGEVNNIKFTKKKGEVSGGVEAEYLAVSGNFKCVTGTCIDPGVIVACYDAKGKVVRVETYFIKDVERVEKGKSVNFEVKFFQYDDDVKFVKMKAFPFYHGDRKEQ